MEENNIIAIHSTCSSKTDDAFKELMHLTEDRMNVMSAGNPASFKKLSAFELERISCDAIKEVAAGTAFRPDEIKLISGHVFPDIIAEKYYGVEVKSTIKDHWTSTGSSIVESTRDKYVEKIYMLFGNLGANVPAFKCRPYQDVLSDIAVTHSPRYLIDMNLNKDDSIFKKMGVEYDVFRTSGRQIEQARRYFADKAKQNGKREMPWWISSSDVDKASSFNIRMWNSLPMEERSILLAKCMILFPETMNPMSSTDKYTNAVLWLCSYCQVVSSCFRDDFSAGGKITKVDGHNLITPVPRVFQTIVDNSAIVEALLSYPDAEMTDLINEYNPALNPDPLKNWLGLCREIGTHYGVSLDKWILNKSKLE